MTGRRKGAELVCANVPAHNFAICPKKQVFLAKNSTIIIIKKNTWNDFEIDQKMINR